MEDRQKESVATLKRVSELLEVISTTLYPDGGRPSEPSADQLRGLLGRLDHLAEVDPSSQSSGAVGSCLEEARAFAADLAPPFTRLVDRLKCKDAPPWRETAAAEEVERIIERGYNLKRRVDDLLARS